MTIKDFLDMIADGDWHIDQGGCIRDDNEDCPLWHAYRLVDPDKYGDILSIDAGVRIGLRRKTAGAIALAADDCGEPALRKRLLKACGLTT